MSLGFYIKDTIKKFIVWTPINALIVSGIIWTINSFENFYFYAFGFVSLIMFVMMYIYPEFIAPLFDKYSPLEEGDLKTKVKRDSEGMPIHYRLCHVDYDNDFIL